MGAILLASSMLHLKPEACVVVEDAVAGIDAALAAGCKAVAVGAASSYARADYAARDMLALDVEHLLAYTVSNSRFTSLEYKQSYSSMEKL